MVGNTITGFITKLFSFCTNIIPLTRLRGVRCWFLHQVFELLDPWGSRCCRAVLPHPARLDTLIKAQDIYIGPGTCLLQVATYIYICIYIYLFLHIYIYISRCICFYCLSKETHATLRALQKIWVGMEWTLNCQSPPEPRPKLLDLLGRLFHHSLGVLWNQEEDPWWPKSWNQIVTPKHPWFASTPHLPCLSGFPQKISLAVEAHGLQYFWWRGPAWAALGRAFYVCKIP